MLSQINVKDIEKIHPIIKKEPIRADKRPISADKIIEFLKNNKQLQTNKDVK